MGQITIYLPDEQARAIRKAARSRKRSVSEWAREQLAAGLSKEWPPDYRGILGALHDDSFVRPTQLEVGNDALREKL